MKVRLCFMILFMSLPVFSEESAVTTSETNGAPAKLSMSDTLNSIYDKMTSSNHWEQVHNKWSSAVINSAERIDRFFSDERLDDEGNDTRIKLSIGLSLKEKEDPEVLRRINIRLSLPRVSKRVQLVLSDLAESEDPSSATEALRDIADSRPDAAVRYNISERKRFKVDADAGVRFGSTVQILGRLRGSRQYVLSDKLQLRWINTFTWYSSDGLVGKTETQFNRQLADDWLFRSSSEIEWREDRSGIRPSQRLSLFKTYSNRRALRLDAGGTWPEVPDPEDIRYYSSVTFRRLIHSKWLFMEITPGVEFNEEHNYETQYFIKVLFDVIIGKVQ